MVSDLGIRLKELRKENKLTQQQLGNHVGLSVGQIAAIENGRRNTPISKVVVIADFFDVSIDYLVGRSDTRTVLRKIK